RGPGAIPAPGRGPESDRGRAERRMGGPKGGGAERRALQEGSVGGHLPHPGREGRARRRHIRPWHAPRRRADRGVPASPRGETGLTRLIALVGPTAAGKSRLAMEIAERVGAEILSVDSMQVYRGMDIGTAKPTPDERERVRHHMIDIAEPQEPFTVARFRRLARQAIEHTTAPVVLIVGGSGLHFRSVVDPMVFRPFDPQVRAEIEKGSVEELIRELEAADPDAGRYVDFSNPRRVKRAVEALRVGGVTPSALAVTEERRRF